MTAAAGRVPSPEIEDFAGMMLVSIEMNRRLRIITDKSASTSKILPILWRRVLSESFCVKGAQVWSRLTVPGLSETAGIPAVFRGFREEGDGQEGSKMGVKGEKTF